ncbi:Proteasome activator complex subunit 4 [Auxenochlorella protothecoides]|uniref:Proteasome activator complex subunit 4 n=1 Tax=Auxenochlorella protothecoides TaxID=3075 RepID=A0A087SHK3_AUXPR|nr:Proteasome activator complex subunit 4 [Auxenochlorella protothecoides]KFM25207.1 Proteasome activator complex subunit 4 [Auxenochlorella protothecoides]
MPSKSVYNEWLPQHLAERVATEEPARYAALVAALKAQWERDSRTLPAAEALRATQPYIALCRTLYHARADLDSTSLHDLVHCQLEMVAQGEGDLMVQTRWALQLQQLLRTHRSKLSIEVPWRPWYLMLRRTVLRDDLEYEGGALSEARRQTLARLIHRLRRHFPRGAAAEIWDEFKTALRDVQRVDGFEALGWLTMLLPTTALKAGDGDWGAWAEEWVALWRAVPHCSYWDALWGALFARLASHDAFGLIDWHRHLPELYTHFLWAFRVPVGTSFADPPFSFDCPKHCQVLFANELASRSECAAHAAIYMLGHGGGPPGADSALAHLEGLVGLLEQYYHPSNGGRWNSGLAHLFKTLASAFGARLLAESNAARRTAERARGPRGASAPPDAPAGDAEAEVDPGGAAAEEDASVDGDDASEAIERVVGALLRLASKAQFSKDKELRRSATRILGLLAEVSPRAVLPGVHAHFVAALETVTSTSVLASAIQTLSLCVRPLLVAGLVLPPEDGGGGVEVAVGMNGDGEEVATPGFPLETEIWVEELLSHVFAVISNLDAPEHRDEHQAEGLGSGEGEETFLLDGNSMFRPLMELLFSRLPPGLRRHAIQRVGRFLLETTLSSVMVEAAVLCNAVAWADPRLAGELAQEAVLAWRINLASSLVMYAGCAAVSQKVEVLGALRALAALPALPVAEALQGLLSSLLLGLLALAREVLDAHLAAPLARLGAMLDAGDFAAACTAEAGARGGREALRALLWQLQGCLAGVSVCLAPLAAAQAAGAAGEAASPAVSLVGELGAAVGSAREREEGAAVVLRALRAADAADPDTLYLLLTVADSFMAAGSAEYSDSLDHASSWAADEKWVSEKPLAGRLYAGAGLWDPRRRWSVHTGAGAQTELLGAAVTLSFRFVKPVNHDPDTVSALVRDLLRTLSGTSTPAVPWRYRLLAAAFTCLLLKTASPDDTAAIATTFAGLLTSDLLLLRQAVAAVQDGTFKPEHAALVQALALTAPAVLGPGLRAAVLEALARPQDVDRPATAAAGECLAGLVASGVPFEDGSWDEWVGPALQEALASAPLEQTSAWASGTLRYAAYELATAGKHGALAQLCALVAGPAHPGAGSGAQYRRLKYLNYLLTEIITVLGNRSHPAFLCSLWDSLLREVPELVSHPGQMVRVEAARLGALLTASVLDQAEFDASVGIMFAVARDAPVQQQPGTPTPSQATGEDGMDFEAAGAEDDASLASLSPPPHAGPGLTPSELGAAAGSAGDNLDPEVEPSPGSAVLMQHEGAEGLEASPSALSLARAPLGKESASPRFQQGERFWRGLSRWMRALTRVAYCVEFVAQAIQGGEGTVLLPWLVRLLPGMLKIQRLIPSELQAVSMAARKAVSLLKYLPLMHPALVKSVLATLVQACGAELWPERASALVYLQYFWFRHVFLLGTAGTAALVTAVVERLSDAKLEVRDLAAATLSGLLKGMEESKTASLRAAFLADVERLLPAKRGRKRMVPGPLPPLPGTAAAAPGPSLARRHAAVQGLRAFVLSSPYDVPAWLPGVLMALVRLAGEPAPIRRVFTTEGVTVTKTLAEFRRTHEEAGLSEVRDQLTSEQWEAIRDVAHPAPYFV